MQSGRRETQEGETMAGSKSTIRTTVEPGLLMQLQDSKYCGGSGVLGDVCR